MPAEVCFVFLPKNTKMCFPDKCSFAVHSLYCIVNSRRDFNQYIYQTSNGLSSPYFRSAHSHLASRSQSLYSAQLPGNFQSRWRSALGAHENTYQSFHCTKFSLRSFPAIVVRPASWWPGSSLLPAAPANLLFQGEVYYQSLASVSCAEFRALQ